MSKLSENQMLDAFEVEELESRFEMAKWIEFVPCDCDDAPPSDPPPSDGEG
ncbi:MAG: hypothetical protein SH848_19505 [Saprospiraceae bacterium]|nr:hypothetical protein [Saprospiraceae bacterium]MDZ4706124.1 hypothetical protein [Saprospiraceae bacterium]